MFAQGPIYIQDGPVGEAYFRWDKGPVLSFAGTFSWALSCA